MGIGRGRTWNNFSDHHALPISGRVLRIYLSLDSKIAANNSSLLQQALQRDPHRVRWNGKPDSLVAPCPRNDGGIDSDDFPAEVDQWPAAVSRINRGVGLQIVAEAIVAIGAT